MANANEPPVHPSPPRPGGRHQIKRSLTELTGPVKLKSGHHARHSVQHNHPPHRRDRYNDDKELQTAHPGTTRRSLDMPRSDALSHSRRPSAMGLRDEDVSRVNSNQLSIKANKDDKLRKELDRTDSRVEGLRQSLVQLHSFSTTTTTRLDETYYAVLEKTSALQNTITALKDLAGASREIYGTFEKESRVLEGDISGQLNALGRFDDQQNTIELLQTRIQSGRAKVQSLSGRVDIVRDHVESWERADQEWQNRTRRRLKVIWSVMFVVTVALITLFLMADFSGTKSSTGSPDMADESMTRTLRHTSLNISRVVPALDKGGDEGTGESLLWKRPREEDGRLREFDEL